MSIFEEGTEVVVRTPARPNHEHNGERGVVVAAYPGHWIAVRFENGDKVVYLPQHVHEAATGARP